jgi:hypothetical protein
MNNLLTAQDLAQQGRYGDTTLVHMNPQEVQGLQSLALANGTTMTRNPNTGMPEAFSLGGVLGSLVPMGVGAALTPFTGPLGAGLLVGGLSYAMTGDLGSGIMSGLGAYGGANLGESFANVGKNLGNNPDLITSQANEAITAPITQSKLLTGGGYDPFTQAMAGEAAGSLPALSQTSASTFTNAVKPGSDQLRNLALKGTKTTPKVLQTENFADKFDRMGVNAGSYYDDMSKGIGDIFSREPLPAMDNMTPEMAKIRSGSTGLERFELAGGSPTQLALSGGSAALGGLEEKDIYGEPLVIPPDRRFYGPYGQLNLSGPTNLRLPMYAKEGGKVSYQNGGIANLTPDQGKMLNGMGDGVSDDIPANIEGEQEAALSDGEFIVPARIVSELGNGSSDAGAEKLYAMIDRIQGARKQTIGTNKEYAKDTNAERYLPA